MSYTCPVEGLLNKRRTGLVSFGRVSERTERSRLTTPRTSTSSTCVEPREGKFPFQLWHTVGLIRQFVNYEDKRHASKGGIGVGEIGTHKSYLLVTVFFPASGL